MFLHLDCQFYLGDRPCKFARPCEDCPHYLPMGPRLLLIKLGALGDVVRTGALIAGLHQLTGDPPHVTWLTQPAATSMVERMPGVHRVLAYNEESLVRLKVEKFDYVICLDKEPGPCAIAMTVQANVRLGIGLSRYGTPYPLNDEAEYYFSLGLDNDEKFFRNQKSYQQLIYEALGLEYRGERFEIDLNESDVLAVDEKFASFNAKSIKHWIGINPGAGGVFANKAWREDGYVALIRKLCGDFEGIGFVLLGGKGEPALIERIMAECPGLPVHSGGTDNTLGEFTALIDRCDLVVCADTLAMHLAVARKKRVVALFGPTCEQEIDLFGLGTKIKSPIECSPCYLRDCDKNPTCQDKIENEAVIAAAIEQLRAIGLSPI